LRPFAELARPPQDVQRCSRLGIREDLSFNAPDGIGEICKQALVQYRTDLQSFVDLYAAGSNVPGVPAQIHQWELSIET
jgi:hypothetical protein